MTDDKKTIKLNFTFFAYASFALVMLKISFGLDWAWGWVLAPVFIMMAPIAVILALATMGIVVLGIVGITVVLADILDRR